MNRPLLPELVDDKSVTRIAELYDSMIQEENFYIYRVARDAGSAPAAPASKQSLTESPTPAATSAPE
jgi:hypothetical protein